MNSFASEAPSLNPLPDLILSLEQATLMAKQIPSTNHPDQLVQIYSSLHLAHQHLSSLISQTQFSLFPPPSLDDRDKPMQVGHGDYEAGADENSNTTIDKVEEKMRDCSIKNRKPKRPLSPSSMAEERRLLEDRDAREINGLDPYGTRLRALDLVYQFHG
ncbi:hypothetical protein P3X46_003750 [Hevea brasiliensis]|uniref:Uncharacterized protein n=1 Tax=Hevea brasiliensis TaxID=3981 RepID=A0ABQ9N9D8_HEVBR|nr:uncharacterized protein LOC110653785 [Hevea brasiliensis]KAJ9188390.1 hypothetical protein P3X46_003750 [Hevea brasiliensis]